MLRLVRPTLRFRTSFLQAAREICREDNDLARALQAALHDFGNYVRRKIGESKGKFLPKGYVPASSFWLISGKRVIGLIHIRHRLTRRLRRYGGHIGYVIRQTARKKGYGKTILKLGLRKGRKLGLKRVLVTCSPGNTASRKIIEGNGGVFWSQATSGQGTVRRYWINLK